MSADSSVVMPILKNRLSRHLSPLEEDRVGASSKESGGIHKAVVCEIDGACDRRMDQEGLALVTEIGTAILTSRSCDSASASQTTTTAGTQEVSTKSYTTSEGERSHHTQQIQALWSQCQPVCIEVRGQTRGGGTSLLLEKWSVQLLSNRIRSPSPNGHASSSGHTSSPQLLLQAVRSYIHFSQIRSWQEVGGKDHTPFKLQLVYRVSSDPVDLKGFSPYSAHHHTFPSLHLTSHTSLLVAVATLPRLPHVPSQLLASSDGATPPAKMLSHLTASSTAASSHCLETSPTSAPVPLGVGRLTKTAPKEGYPFSPPLPSPLSPKLLMGLADHTPSPCLPQLEKAVERLDLTNSSPESAQVDSKLSRHPNSSQLDSNPRIAAGQLDSDPRRITRQVYFDPTKATTPQNSDLIVRPTTSGPNSNILPTPSKDTSGDGGGAVPPASCSPAPFSRMHMGRERGGAKRRSCAIVCKRPSTRAPPQRSNSAPVFVPSLCLLGTFEESVLNGRLEPCGHVEGFTAEVGASGAFCPPHIRLPVSAAFYSLHDNHGGTSPYLGQIDLSGVGKRGYQVPRKGTVQVTLFNPNDTVVKMYIVRYDFSDMPALTQTFLRQKILSRPTHSSGQGATPTTYLPSLHYLIHLRFLCSKSKRVYLHRDIRLIFARRAPDTDPDDSKVTLYTTTEGPLEPKYSPTSR